jgi:hypothetical protein
LGLAEAYKTSAKPSLGLAEAYKTSPKPSLGLAEAYKTFAKPSLGLAEAYKTSAKPSSGLAEAFDIRRTFTSTQLLVRIKQQFGMHPSNALNHKSNCFFMIFKIILTFAMYI